MDNHRFDLFVRSLARGFSRRNVVSGLTFGAGGWLLSTPGHAAPARASARTVSIDTDNEGAIVAARAGSTAMDIARDCDDVNCTATVTFSNEGSPRPFFSVNTEISGDNRVAMRFMGDEVDIAVSLDPSTGLVDVVADGQAVARGSFDASSGKVTGVDTVFELPPELADRLAPMAPALSALVGEVGSWRYPGLCPWGSPGPTFPPPDASGARKGGFCRFLCGVGGVGLAVGCCLSGDTCSDCITAGGGFTSSCSSGCPSADSAGTGGAIGTGETETSASGAAPTAQDSATGGAPAGDATAVPDPGTPPAPTSTPVPPPTATAIPTVPPACEATECQPGWFFDEATCSCVCPPSPCAPGSNWQFDRESCSCICIPPACPENWVADETSCTCVCVPFACPPNFAFEPTSCSCFCPEAACAEGEVFDAGICACIGAGAGAGAAVGEAG